MSFNDGDIFPEEIVSDIMSRLRARDVLRFRCVSKSQKSLLDSSYFIDMHHNRSTKTNSSEFSYFSPIGLYSYHFIDSDNIKKRVPRDMDFIPNDKRVVGFASGLYLLRAKKYVDKYAILNPSTREYKELPDLPICYGKYIGFLDTTCGFCYDSANEDYKVVLIFRKRDHEVMIYSLKSNTWRRIEGSTLQSSTLLVGRGLAVGSSLHWQNFGKGIVAFDIGTEKFRTVSLPNEDGCIRTIGKLEGRLYVIYYYGRTKTFSLLMMMDYGVNESWTKILSISVSSPITIRPLCFSKDRKEILILHDAGEGLMSYNVNKQATKTISADAISLLAHEGVLIEKLVQLCKYGKRQKI